MNKSFVIFFLLLIQLNSYTQEMPSHIKYDAYEIAENGRYALVTKGKKQGLYDLNNNNYRLPLSKSPLVMFLYKSVVAKIEVDSIVYYDLQVDTSKDITKTNIKRYKSSEIDQISQTEYLVRNFENRFLGLTAEGDFSFDWANPRQASGLLNSKSNKWIIPRKYADLYLFDQHIVALNYDSVYIENPEESYTKFNYEHSYDIYSKVDDSWVLESEKVKKITTKQIANLLDADVVDTLGIPNYYLTEKKGKKGLVYFNDAKLFEGWRSILEFQSHLENEYELIHLNNNSNFIGAIHKDSARKIRIYEINAENELTEIATGNKFAYLNATYEFGDKTWTDVKKEKYADADFYRTYGIKMINDSLFIVRDVYTGEALPLYTYEGFDSTGVEGESLYDHTPSDLKTGVFNIKSQEWELEPAYFNIYPARDNGWVVSYLKYERGEYSMFPDEKMYFTGAKDYQFGEDLISYHFLQDTHRLKEILPDKNIHSILKCPSPASLYLTDAYYVFTGNKMKIVYNDVYDRNNLLIETDKADFIQLNNSLGFAVSKNGEDWRIEFPDTTFKHTSSKSWSFKTHKFINYSGEECQFTYFYNGDMDSMLLRSANEDQCNGDYESSEFSVNINGDIMVINDLFKEPYIMVDDFGEFYDDGIDEQEASAIWKTTPNGWRKISPYYAQVIPVKDKFIARTKEYSGEILLSGGEGYAMFDEEGNIIVTGQQSSRSIFLDENAKPISFMDYYDFNKITDLGFGLQFETDKGAFFVNYEGKAITNDEWDYFELDNKRLKAVRYDPDFPDNGTLLYDEWGDIIDPKPSIVEYFDL